jgi:hypothetical protein
MAEKDSGETLCRGWEQIGGMERIVKRAGNIRKENRMNINYIKEIYLIAVRGCRQLKIPL